MSMQYASPNPKRVVRQFQSVTSGSASAAGSRDRGIRRPYPAGAAWGDPQRLVPPAEADAPPASPWRVAFEFVMEGFAMYGASLHPTATMPVQIIRTSSKSAFTGAQWSTDHASRPWEDDHAVEFERDVRADVPPSHHWSWPGSLAATIAARWTHWRREREIKRAVAALSQYDDRTLRDMGICGRADIEQVVRYCRDC